ncbi:rCG35169 [Rattus norvegicus]|uniref:RCG35169 n=1 Tax=Rattus norvegicus TaxID=10116 RepID=A6HCZ1_RAT|nr:rCG35169 [Rattus norvegicus]
MFREEEREPPAGVTEATPDTFPEDDAPPSLPWERKDCTITCSES